MGCWSDLRELGARAVPVSVAFPRPVLRLLPVMENSDSDWYHASAFLTLYHPHDASGGVGECAERPSGRRAAGGGPGQARLDHGSLAPNIHRGSACSTGAARDGSPRRRPCRTQAAEAGRAENGRAKGGAEVDVDQENLLLKELPPVRYRASERRRNNMAALVEMLVARPESLKKERSKQQDIYAV